MRAVGIKILKNNLSRYVRLASAGETILVTDRDEVVAELGPPTPGRAQGLDDPRLARAIRNGWITPPVHTLGPPPRGAPVLTLQELLADLDADREDRP